MYHIGKIIKMHSAKKDSGTQATVEMWDENLMILAVDKAVAKEAKEGSYVLVDYEPKENLNVLHFKQTVCKVLPHDEGRETWRIFKEKFEKMKGSSQMQMGGGGPKPLDVSYA